MIYFSALLVSLLLTIAMMPLLVRAALRFGIVDIPDARKVHRDPIPRIGGVAIAIGSIVPFVLWRQPGNFVAAYLAGAGILVVLGLLDDMRGLNYKIKFAGQIIAASIVIFYGGLRITNLGGLLPDGMILPEWFLIILTLVAVVGVTNAINLSDGLDGLAGGVCFLSLCCLAYLAYAIEDATALFIAVSLAGAVFGFLRFNTHPATLFMGDAGSLFLGFSVITLSLGMTQGGSPLSPVLPLIILGVPVLDTVTVMAERLYHGRSPFMPDKNHFHHRIMRLGFYHTESVFFIYLIQGCLIIAAILFRFHSDWLLLESYVIFSALILGGFFVAEKTGWKVRRFDLIDRVIKGQLKALVDRGVLIRLSFRVIEFGLPALVFATCFLPTAVPVYFQIVSAGLLGMLLFIWLLNKNWLRRIGLS
nr:MraY family glycosyltransferase [Syntrophales bacterium]